MFIYDCDFGWGRLIFMGLVIIVYEGLVYVLVSFVNDGSLSLFLGLRFDYMDIFVKLVVFF